MSGGCRHSTPEHIRESHQEAAAWAVLPNRRSGRFPCRWVPKSNPIASALLGYLKQLRLDPLKIGNEFVRDITTDSNDAVIVETVMGLS